MSTKAQSILRHSTFLVPVRFAYYFFFLINGMSQENAPFLLEAPVAKFLVPELGGYSRLWHRVVQGSRANQPAYGAWRAVPGRYDNPMP